MEVYLGADHAGYDKKNELKTYLEEKGIKTIDLGTFSHDSVDYPDIAREVAEKVKEKKELGILICGTGLGMSMVANKVKGVRAAVCTNVEMAEMARKHNNANMLCLGARVIESDLMVKIADKFLETDFEGGRHERRVEKFED